MDPAATKVMQAVVMTLKGGMAMEVVDVSIFKPATFRAFFSSMFLSDGGQNQGSQSQCTSFIFFFSIYILNVSLRRKAGPGIPRSMYVYLSHLFFFF